MTSRIPSKTYKKKKKEDEKKSRVNLNVHGLRSLSTPTRNFKKGKICTSSFDIVHVEERSNTSFPPPLGISKRKNMYLLRCDIVHVEERSNSHDLSFSDLTFTIVELKGKKFLYSLLGDLRETTKCFHPPRTLR
eukprot:TRINITY_DN1197_c0_g1_i6.p1 TRINITY_DN1197_c0_g1~~TRINITY_DN1197_c0_g1_i6.p1  ORF type:complete len:134 (+),score=21.24 TRINITY_DN1197_c0_g1_i6:401-802(+)